MFPIMLNVRGRVAVVVGGGPVGLRKARALAAAGAEVKIVAAGAAPRAAPKGASIIRRPYRAAVLKGADLVFACTPDRRLNARIAADARKIGALVNAADQPDDCDFHLPAVAYDGDVVLAVGTGGAAPGLAASLKGMLAAALPRRAGQFAALLADLRRQLKAAVPETRRRTQIVRRLLADGAYEEFIAGGAEALRAHMKRLIDSPAGDEGADRPARHDRQLRVLCVGVSHKTAPVSMREKLALDAAQTRAALDRLARRWGDAEFVVVSTCNRTELYAASADLRAADLQRWLAEFHQVRPALLQRAAYRLADRQASRHLFRVAAGLESMVPGEDQIVSQLKAAYAAAVHAGAARTALNELFQRAFRVAKHVRSQTQIASGKVSVASVAVDRVGEALGHLAGRCVLCVGAGKTGKLMLEHLRRLGAAKVLIANRSRARAVRLAERCGGEVLPFGRLAAGIARCDVLLSSTASRAPVIRRDTVAAAMKRRRRPLLIIDIAVPRDVEPSVRDLPRVRLLDIDDLQAVVRRTLRSRRSQRRRAQSIIDEHVDQFHESLLVHGIAPAIDALYRRMHDIADDELAAARRKLTTHDDADQDEAILQRALHRTVRRILHPATANLRRTAGSDSARLYVQTLRKLFELGTGHT
ncbi:MAG TPA: glutamyl-tRNA reductase [Phycisphaerae bacterium]|nr:glutamyl-tRNA reductase [Phycisphaerae bacterium]